MAQTNIDKNRAKLEEFNIRIRSVENHCKNSEQDEGRASIKGHLSLGTLEQCKNSKQDEGLASIKSPFSLGTSDERGIHAVKSPALAARNHASEFDNEEKVISRMTAGAEGGVGLQVLSCTRSLSFECVAVCT